MLKACLTRGSDQREGAWCRANQREHWIDRNSAQPHCFSFRNSGSAHADVAATPNHRLGSKNSEHTADLVNSAEKKLRRGCRHLGFRRFRPGRLRDSPGFTGFSPSPSFRPYRPELTLKKRKKGTSSRLDERNSLPGSDFDNLNLPAYYPLPEESPGVSTFGSKAE